MTNSLPPPAFADEAGCAGWLTSLPLTNIGFAQESLGDQLQRLAAADIDPLQRVKIAERLRETVLYLHGELAKRFVDRPLPLSDAESQAWQQALRLWTALWENYSACLRLLLDHDPRMEGWAARTVQRGLFVGKELVRLYGQVRRQPTPEHWEELHAYYRFAEMLEVTSLAVRDKLLPHAEVISSYSTYAHALLLARADPCALTAREWELTDRWLQGWSRKFFPDKVFRSSEQVLLVIDLLQGTGLATLEDAPDNSSPSLRYGSPDKLSVSLRQRQKRLRAGATPAELGLGDDVSVAGAERLLAHLYERWCMLPVAQGAPATEQQIAVCGGGLYAVFYRLSGRTFVGESTRDRLSYRAIEDAATFDTLPEHDSQRDQAEEDWPWESWVGDRLGFGGSLERRVPGNRMQLNQLLVARDATGRISCGIVSWLGELGTTLRIGIKLWPGEAGALILRAVSGVMRDEPAVPAIALPGVGREPSSFLLPPRYFQVGRRVETPGAGKRSFRLVKSLERGADFERVAFSVE
jgi:cyclic-di-GMP-binding protein